MDKAKLVKIKAELERRKAEAERPKFDMKAYCFDTQYSFFRENGPRFRTAVCSRRSGKTVGIVADMFDTCISEPDSLCLYITVTKQAARNIIWADINRIKEDFDIDCTFDNARLTVKFPNRSRIVIEGAKDRTEIEKYRGWKLRKCYIDECQSFRSYVKELVNDVITPALRDQRGELYLTGTPGPVKAGYFFESSHSPNWLNHKWTAFDNPHMHSPENGNDLEDVLREERIMKGITEDDPSYIRETFGEWIEDLDSLVFKFNRGTNVYETLPKSEFHYIFGIDIGYNDSDAIAVLAYDTKDKKAYLVDEYLKSKQDITSLVNEIKRLRDIYNPIKMVMDAGALGKKVQEEILSRHQLPIEAAEKARKVEFIELMNDDLRNGRLLSYKGSQFEDDCMLVQWDKESIYRNPEKPKISDVFHSDICDAVLYAWRYCHHFSSTADIVGPKPGTDAYMDELEAREAEAMDRAKDGDDIGFGDDSDWDFISN